MTREEAWVVLQRYVTGVALLRHCLAVEAAMRAYAAKFGEDVEYWGAVGLLHDVDFEKYPEEHPGHARAILAAHGCDDEFITNVESHARNWDGERTLLQKTLLALDELTGFVIACALVRPDRSLDNMEVKSVRKKMKDKAFARAVNRETITGGAAAMGVDMDEHIRLVIDALAAAAKAPGHREVPMIG